VFKALNEHITLKGGRVIVCDANSRHAFWLIHLDPNTYMAVSAE